MQKKYDSLIYIGRFQIEHNGHTHTIIESFKKTDNLVILIGSAMKARDIKNPFTYEERKSMIESSLKQFLIDNPTKQIIFRPIEDSPYNNNNWIKDVQLAVKDAHVTHGISGTNHALTGYVKDKSSFYLELFPQWKQEHVSPCLGSNGIINASDIRTELWTGKPLSDVSENVVNWVNSWINSNPETYKSLCEEHTFIENYKSGWSNTQHPVIFTTTDAAVIVAGHVLLVKRGANPGKGLIALPGGFLNPEEQLKTGMIRELYEETGLKVAKGIIDRSIVRQEVFDAPDRSLRGRTITYAFKMQLHDTVLPKVKGGKVYENNELEIEGQFWMPLNEIYENRDRFFEDHYHILQSFGVV